MADIAFYDPSLLTRPYQRIALSKDGDLLIIFPYDPDLVARARTIQGRRWDPIDKIWSAPKSSLKQIFEIFPRFFYSGALKGLVEAELELTIIEEKIESGIDIDKELKVKPFGYQREGIDFLRKQRTAILADEMGVGKTLQAIGFAFDKKPVLVICPNTLKLNWDREIGRARPGDTKTVISTTIKPDCLAGWNIVNYDILDKIKEELLQCSFKCILIDEAHYIKNYKAIRTQKTQEIAEKIAYRVAITGSPILNRATELFPLLVFAGKENPDKFVSWGIRYAGGTKTRWGWEFKGATNIQELRSKMASYFLRRTKAEVLPDLPTKTFQNVEVELSNEREYRKAEADIIAWLIEIGADNEKIYRAQQGKILAKMNYLRQLAATGKMEAIRAEIDSVLEQDNKVVVFSTFVSPLKELHEVYSKESVIVIGDVATAERDKAVQDFQASEQIKIFLGSIDAAGLGITLTAAHVVTFLDFPWTPAKMSQAEDRLARIGQKDNVLVKNLLAKGSIDERIIGLLEKKRNIINQIIEGKETIAPADIDIMKEAVGKLINREIVPREIPPEKLIIPEKKIEEVEHPRQLQLLQEGFKCQANTCRRI